MKTPKTKRSDSPYGPGQNPASLSALQANPPRRPGRTRVTPKGERVKVEIALTAGDKARLEAEAKRSGVTVAELVRWHVARFVPLEYVASEAARRRLEAGE